MFSRYVFSLVSFFLDLCFVLRFCSIFKDLKPVSSTAFLLYHSSPLLSIPFFIFSYSFFVSVNSQSKLQSRKQSGIQCGKGKAAELSPKKRGGIPKAKPPAVSKAQFSMENGGIDFRNSPFSVSPPAPALSHTGNGKGICGSARLFSFYFTPAAGLYCGRITPSRPK